MTDYPMTMPWAAIVSRYRDGLEHGAPVKGMLNPVEQIEASKYARALHAWTSMSDLCIAQEPRSSAAPYDGPHLRISPLADGAIEFRYVDTYIGSRQWHRIVQEHDAFRRLEHFIDQLHWVARAKNRDLF
jgi:hypothetical protein